LDEKIEFPNKEIEEQVINCHQSIRLNGLVVIRQFPSMVEFNEIDCKRKKENDVFGKNIASILQIQKKELLIPPSVLFVFKK